MIECVLSMMIISKNCARPALVFWLGVDLEIGNVKYLASRLPGSNDQKHPRLHLTTIPNVPQNSYVFATAYIRMYV